MARKEHFTMRLQPDTLRRLTHEARLTGTPRAALAERYLEEGFRAARHPGIVFRDGPAGRRPGVAGLGLDVWEIVETVHMNGEDLQEAAEYLALNPAFVQVAIDYYREYPDEIDNWIAANDAMSDEHEAVMQQRRDALPA